MHARSAVLEAPDRHRRTRTDVAASASFVDEALDLQRTAGNQAVSHMVTTGVQRLLGDEASQIEDPEVGVRRHQQIEAALAAAAAREQAPARSTVEPSSPPSAAPAPATESRPTAEEPAPRPLAPEHPSPAAEAHAEHEQQVGAPAEERQLPDPAPANQAPPVAEDLAAVAASAPES